MNEKALRNLFRALSENQMSRLEDYQERVEWLCDELAKSEERVRTANREVEDLKEEKEEILKANAELSSRCAALKRDGHAAEKILNHLKEILEDEDEDEDAYNKKEYIFTR